MWMLLTSLTGVAIGQNDAPTTEQQLRRAIELVETGDVERARTLLRQVRKDTRRPGIRQFAELYEGLISGADRERQSYFLNRRVVDRVVLVPDETTFIAAINAWEEDRFWPVLIEDSWFTPLFIERFQPRLVLRMRQKDFPLSAPGRVPGSATSLTERRTRAALRAAATGITNEVAAADRPLPGVVLIDPESPQRCGGLALAAGRGQPIGLLTLRPDQQPEKADYSVVEAMGQVTRTLVKHWDTAKSDRWTAITLAGRYPLTYVIPGDPEGEPHAMDDRLGRDVGGQRTAVVGRVIGDPTQSVYQAMCSLFLTSETALLADDYPNRGGRAFAQYAIADTAKRLAEFLDQVKIMTGDSLLPAALRDVAGVRHQFDFIWMNSSGGARDFVLRAPASYRDIPIGRAAAFYVVHSFSAADPTATHTIAGRAIAGGGFWYFGSVWEPYLPAFNRPRGIAEKAAFGTPLAMAVRSMPGGRFAKAWRLTLIGDPLWHLHRKPGEREKPTALPGTKDVIPISTGSWSDRFHNAMLLRLDTATNLALVAIQRPSAMPPDRLLAAAAYSVAAGRPDAVRALPISQVRRDRLLISIYENALHRSYEAALERGDVVRQIVRLRQILAITQDKSAVARVVREWAGDDADRWRRVKLWYEIADLSADGRAALAYDLNRR